MKEITTKELQNLIESSNDLNIIDVREVDEVANGKIKGVINIPLGLLEFRKQELNKSKEYIMVCRSGGRSGQATKYLESQGFNVTNMTGGMLAWEGEIE
ncbi:rhodanese-like domain protein [Gracilibacillus boraciitolerans JCM 21714]|uniref:Rhodanese-like domain protein n=1 Tax=Gracilibacillus boraciitolerans JCM 21714 TaxID=1298598 RepID=W4VPJ3_9BACI|nr:rhodanese-like domain-containing protein [Gracilibacillus boraciitolerans]GAE95300.1 rhodanese-like domain protein [Gracilibacillus boraciitolerans JCM 21714]